MGRLTLERTASGWTKSHSYDSFGNEVSTVDSDEGTTTHSFDVAGRMITVNEPQFGGTLTEYNALGDVVRETVNDANDSRVKRVFDGSGRLVAVLDADRTVTTYSYTAAGFVQTGNCTDLASPTPGSSDLSCRGTGLHNATWNVTTSGTGDPVLVNPAATQSNTRYVVLIHGLVAFDWNIKDIDIRMSPDSTTYGKVKKALEVTNPNVSVVALAYYGHEYGTDATNDASKAGPPGTTGTKYRRRNLCYYKERKVDQYANHGGPEGYKESGTFWSNHQHKRCSAKKSKATVALHSTDTGIRHLAYHVSWFIYNRYYKKGIYAVDVIGHSLGGVIIHTAAENTEAAALYHDYARDGGKNRWPPATLPLQDIVTVGAPHDGVTPIAQLINEELKQLAEGGSFIRYLRNYPVLYGDWTLIGSDEDCVQLGPASFCIPPTSSLGRYPSGPNGAWDFGDHNVVYRDVLGHCKILHDDYWNVDNCGPLAVYGPAGFPLGNSSPTTQLMPVIWARDKALGSYDY